MKRNLLAAAIALLLPISTHAQAPAAQAKQPQYHTIDEVRHAFSSHYADWKAAQQKHSSAVGHASSLRAQRIVDQKAVTAANQEAARYASQANVAHSALVNVVNQCHSVTKSDIAKAQAALNAAPADKKKQAEADLKAADHTGLCMSYSNQIAVSNKH